MADVVEAGKLKHQVGIQVVTETPDEFGGASAKEWNTVATRRASVSPLRGQERSAAKQVTPELSHRVVMRYYSGLTTKNRLVFGSRILEIQEIITPDEIKHMMIIMCIERVGEQWLI